LRRAREGAGTESWNVSVATKSECCAEIEEFFTV
jgi:hypothetical protein